jgi:hypothetical protein
MWRSVAIGVVLAGVLAGCSVGGLGMDGGGSAKPLPTGTSRLFVYQALVGGSRYIEGSRGYVTVTAKAGGRDTESYTQMRTADPVFSAHVAPGWYTIHSWQRPCDGNCGNLGPVSDQCHLTVTLQADKSNLFDIELTAGHGCKIVRQFHSGVSFS